MSEQFTEADVDFLDHVLVDADCVHGAIGPGHVGCTLASSRCIARKALSALAAAGRLLPPAEVEYGWASGDAKKPQFYGWHGGDSDRVGAEAWLASRGDEFHEKYGPWRLMRRRRDVVISGGSWSAVSDGE